MAVLEGTRAITDDIGTLVIRLRKERRFTELFGLHAELADLEETATADQVRSAAAIEWTVAFVPDAAAGVLALCERRVRVLLRDHQLGRAEASAHSALAVLLLRQGRYAEVEQHGQAALAKAGLWTALAQVTLKVMIIAREELRQPCDDLTARLDQPGSEGAASTPLGLRVSLNFRGAARHAADLREFMDSSREEVRPERTDRLLAAWRVGALAPHRYGAVFLCLMLHREGRSVEMLEVHAQPPFPDGPVSGTDAMMATELEWAVVKDPGMPAEVIDLAAGRLQQIADIVPFTDLAGSGVRAVTLRALAAARLRQGRFDEVEPLCVESLSTTYKPVSGRASALAIVALARHVQGKPCTDLLAQAQALDPGADLVGEATAVATGPAGGSI